MITNPEQVREQIAALLLDPAGGTGEVDGTDAASIDALAARLEEAHDVLVRALESVDDKPGKGS